MILLLTGAVTHIWAAPPGGSASDLVRAAIRKEGRIDLSGTSETVLFTPQGQVKAQTRVFWSSQGMIRTEYLTGPAAGRVLVTRPLDAWEYRPGEKKVYLTLFGAAADLEKDWEMIAANHAFEDQGTERIAGRETRIVNIRSKYPGRPSRKLWIEPQMGVILKSEFRDASNALASATAFTSIDFNGKANPGLFSPPSGIPVVSTEGGQQPVSVEELAKLVGFPLVYPRSLPEGFRFQGVYPYRCRRGAYSAQLRYTDGLTSFSVFERWRVCPKCGEEVESGFPWRRGKRKVAPESCELLAGPAGKTVKVDKDKLSFVVVGDLAREELSRVAEGLK